MNAQLAEWEEPDGVEFTEDKVPWVMKKLKPVHLQICALLAQGFRNVEVASMASVTPQYITMLLAQPLIRTEIARVGEIAGQRLELMFEKTVDVIGDTMQNGNRMEQLKAARLQLEATKRIGRPDPNAVNPNVSDDRLEKLATRLEGLIDQRRGGLYDERGNPIEEAEVIREWTHGGVTEATV